MIRRLEFPESDPPIAIDIMPAIPEYNALFMASAMAHVRPFFFAAQVGRLDEKVAEKNLAITYAEAVIVGSPTPGPDQFVVEDWRCWLLSHREEFASIRSIAVVKRNFDPDAEVVQDAQSPTSGEARPDCDAADAGRGAIGGGGH
jgi:hypothetical protein